MLAKLRNIETVKVIGAGSIGNHLANAARRLGCRVAVTDTSRAALQRMRTDVYPARYGVWDEDIRLYLADECPRGGFDLICIGTPPDSHLALARQSLLERPKALQIEKPLCPPDLQGASELYRDIESSETRVFVGYDHVVGKAAETFATLLANGIVGNVSTFDVEFREDWRGIFRAHPWLSGPADSYLGFWQRGGGASGEHSHALNFWQHVSHLVGGGRVVDVTASVRYVTIDGVDYDDLCLCHLRTENGLLGRVVQDVVTRPVKKEAVVIGAGGTLRWVNGYRAGADAVVVAAAEADPEIIEVPKSRPDDFICELQHIDASLDPQAPQSPLSVERGFDTMLVIAAAHRSQALGRTVRIDYARGPSVDALI